MPEIVFLGADFGCEAARQALPDDWTVTHPEAEPEAVAAALTTADALLDASMKVPLSDEMLAAATRLKIISTATTGSDHIARPSLDRRGIPVHTLREDPELLQNLTPAAELTWALLLACARRLPAAAAHVKAGQWVREDFPGVMLNGKTLGVIGCGRIGGWMARYAQAFGMSVLGYDPHQESLPEGVRPSPLPDLVEASDFLSVHVHLSPDTRGLLSADLLKRVKPGAIVINTSRGAVWDEAALLSGLESGQIGAAGTDVLEHEPDTANDPLVAYARTHDNLIITPHCGGFSPDAVRLVCAHAAGKIRAMLEGDA